jgi:hypothetical protein
VGNPAFNLLNSFAHSNPRLWIFQSGDDFCSLLERQAMWLESQPMTRLEVTVHAPSVVSNPKVQRWMVSLGNAFGKQCSK